MKTFKYVAIVLAVLAPIAYFAPLLALVYVTCGLYDVSRNRPLSADLMRRYFLGNGVLTWLLSPFNVLMDILALPHINKGVYRVEDLPPAWQAEVARLIDAALQANLVDQLAAMARKFPRTMVFFKWYGVNVDSGLAVPAFHERWSYIQTIGVSVFNKQVITLPHFGPLRPTLRLLYNLNEIGNRTAYIVVGETTNYWRDNKLFIFDDTLLHQSFNQSDTLRYCLFVDMVRPARFAFLLIPAVRLIHLLFHGVNYLFYRRWTIIGR